jgi:hypothetical protein
MEMAKYAIEAAPFDTDELIGKQLYVKFDNEVNPNTQMVNEGVPVDYSPKSMIPNI